MFNSTFLIKWDPDSAKYLDIQASLMERHSLKVRLAESCVEHATYQCEWPSKFVLQQGSGVTVKM